MGSIRTRKLKEGGVRFQAEIRLKGHPIRTATFDRRTDAKNWIKKNEADIRAVRHQVYAESKKHTSKEAAEKYSNELSISKAKQGHLKWWIKEMGALYLQDVRPSLISEKKQKLLTKINSKEKTGIPSTCNR